MGTYGKSIVKGNIDEIVTLLNKAYADEWLAHYQYWVGSKVVKGIMKEAVIAELVQHAADELRHATMVADRIIQLGGTPLLHPKDWLTHTICGYDAPENPQVLEVLAQNIKGEQCAISVYNKIATLTKDSDIVTYNIATQIMADEVLHEEELQALEEDILGFIETFKGRV
ncbi:MAG: ferritin [Campylobacteraceae bacterium]|jgi:bacterioferritin|nr:ferritin [Campylobacteraceae bacterium]